MQVVFILALLTFSNIKLTEGDQISGKSIAYKTSHLGRLLVCTAPFDIAVLMVSDVLDEAIEMMEELQKEYEYQEYQLTKMHGTLKYLELGYNSLKQELSVTECSASYLLGQVRGDAEALEEHGEQMEMAVDEINTCLEETCETLDRVEELVRA